MLTRRSFFVAGAAFASGCSAAHPPVSPSSDDASALAALEARVGGRVGVFAIDPDSGRSVAHRPDERFAMCSTFKWTLAAATLARVDRGELTLDRELAYGERDLLEYAPKTREHVARGRMSIEALADAAVTLSDNTAANLLLGVTGGPEGLTRFFRALGDSVSRLDRDEPTLNTNLPRDPRDTTTPRAMAGALSAVLLGTALSPPSREKLTGWLLGCRTGADRLPAGVPESWKIGHKTGSGENGANNDVGVLWPPGRGPIFVASYLSESTASSKALAAAHAEVARIVVASF